MDDNEFMSAFHTNSLPSSEFRHGGHLRLAWLVLQRHGPEEAVSIVTREIRRFATAQGAPDRYHETLTQFWVRLVSHAKENAAEAKTVNELVERFPILLDKDLPYRHWRRESFGSEEARTGWFPPDLMPLLAC